MKSLITPILAFLAMFFINSCSDSPTGTSPTEGKGIYFFSYNGESTGESAPPIDEMFYINADGSGKRTIIPEVPIKRFYTVSNDKKKMIIGNDNGVYSINIDGTGNVRLVTEDIRANSLSSDGNKFTYVGKNRALYIVNIDGTNHVKLLDSPSYNYISMPIIYQDNQRVFYTITGGLYSVKIDGTDNKNIFKWPSGQISGLKLSPDQKQIVFSTNNDTTGFATWKIDVDGRNVKKLFSHRYNSLYVSEWSKDGLRLLVTFTESFDQGQRFQTDVFEISSVDGSGLKSLASEPNMEESPTAWSADNMMILYRKNSNPFGSNQDGIYTMNADGSNKKKVNTGLSGVSNLAPAFWSE